MKSLKNGVQFFCLFLLTFAVESDSCPAGCECDFLKHKLKCSFNQLTDRENLILGDISNEIQQLDLTKNGITSIDVEIRLPGLKKLILSQNNIQTIHTTAFKNLSHLLTLDLTENSLSYVSREVLSPLISLERLKLRSNKLKRLDVDLFSDLKNLRMLDLSDNPWHCDCALTWFGDWVRTAGIKLQSAGKCATPESLYGTSLRKLELECAKFGGLELMPSHDQVVFAGDALALRCRGIGLLGRVEWIWKNSDLLSNFEVAVTERTVPEHGMVESRVQIDKLLPEHSGDWICQQVSGGNHSSTLSILVVSDSTQYCPLVTSHDSKGTYYWPKTVIGHDLDLPCVVDHSGSNRAFASYSCGMDGEWRDLNTSACPYVSETTQILERFATENTSTAIETIYDKSKLLLNITSRLENLTDPMDIVFVSQTVEKYSQHVDTIPDLSHVLVDIISMLSKSSQYLLSAAQERGQACSRLRRTLESIAEATPEFYSHRDSLAIQEFTVTSDGFMGLACAWRRESGGARRFHCINNGRALVETSDRDLLALVELPESLFAGIEPYTSQLVVSMFANSVLFPDLSLLGNSMISTVIGINIGGMSVRNLSEPVMIMIKPDSVGSVSPVWFEPKLTGGYGGWQDDGCELSSPVKGLTVFHCHRLGYYALRQKITEVGVKRSLFGLGISFVGTFVLVSCLALSSCTYIACLRSIQMPRRAKHSVINTWISILFLSLIYSNFTTEDTRLCELVGISLHYFSLTSLLWMTVAANNMYKRLSRGSRERPVDELPPGPPIKKPILGLYLVGWGIGLIVCGISGAVHLRDYAQPTFCFLGAGPAFSALLIPTVILSIVLLLFYFLSFCAIKNNDMLSEGTQGTEPVDLELLDDGGGCPERTDHRSARSEGSDSEDLEDPEHSPLIQLKAHIIVLLLFLLLWVSAALTTICDAHVVFPFQEQISSCLYDFMALCLGTFILYFFCVARSDVREQWSEWCRLLASPRRCCRTRNISDTNASVPLQSTTAVPIVNNYRPPSVNSGVTGRSSSSHRTKAVIDLNNCDSEGSQCRPANVVNLVAMHRQVYRSNHSMPTYQEIGQHNVVEAFYNPRQSIVAKKFFKRQRRNRRNELGARRRGDGGGNSDGEGPSAHRTWRPSAESAVFLSSDMENNSDKLPPNLFGCGSKINNTNIHVGRVARRKGGQSPRDPNVLSEEDEDKGGEKVLLSRLVIGAELDDDSSPTTVDKDTVGSDPPDLRSVELQCSLGDSSDLPEPEDSFCQKIDCLRLRSDEEPAAVSPPHYVTVLDPKYGVVKVTMSDYQQQSHRLSLAPSPEESQLDPPVIPSSSAQPVRLLNNRPKRKRKNQPSASLPCSPDKGNSPPPQSRSLPSSPEASIASRQSLEMRRPSPKLTLPPPPDFPAPDTDDDEPLPLPLQSEGDVQEQYRRPDSPISPVNQKPFRQRPSSDNLDRERMRLLQESLAEEAKKETSV